ncbi:MAG: uncharacterized protein QOJ07_2843 [Thermoleophilaceae bacterium]|nr:uncharacterized protein [Thermoleophilaceae bacterium]
METAVKNNPDEHRYEITADGEPAGFTVYRARPGLIAFIHTEIDPKFEGHGLGSKLIAAALQDVRDRGLAVLPFCPFVNSYIHRHREYAALVPEQYHEEFDL